jgi:glycosyltransferase involved in cell wall biosynthesis
MTVLYLTNNPRLAGTARILLSWITLGAGQDVQSCVAVQSRGTLSEWLDAHAVPLIVTPMPWPDGRRPLASLMAAWRLARWARRRGVALIHCNEHDVYPFATLVRRFLRVPLVCHVRFVIDREFTTWAFRGWKRPQALLWTTEQQRHDSSEAIQGVVPDTLQHLIRLGPDAAVFNPDSQARAAARLTLGLGDDAFAVGMASALRPIKRVGDFIDLVEDLGRSDSRVVGLIAGGVVPGEEQYAEEIERRLRQSPLAARLRWVGHLEAMAPFLRALDLFVSTSEYETFGNSVCEAMACRVPVVAYAGGSVAEVIGDTGAVVATGDLAALTVASRLYASNAAVRTEAAMRGYLRATGDLSPQTSYSRLLAVYDALVEPRNRRNRDLSSVIT